MTRMNTYPYWSTTSCTSISQVSFGVSTRPSQTYLCSFEQMEQVSSRILIYHNLLGPGSLRLQASVFVEFDIVILLQRSRISAAVSFLGTCSCQGHLLRWTAGKRSQLTTTGNTSTTTDTVSILATWRKPRHKHNAQPPLCFFMFKSMICSTKIPQGLPHSWSEGS